MNTQLVQNIRYKLQKRVRRLNSVDFPLFSTALRQFWIFFDRNITLLGIAESLVHSFPDISDNVERILKGEGLVGTSEEEAAALGYSILRRLAVEDKDSRFYFHLTSPYRGITKGSNISDALEAIRDVFLEPFYEYVDEQLDDQRAILAILLRYKQRSEWFYRQQLWSKTQNDSQNAEKHLALDLYSYLHDQGIDFMIESFSPSGKIDLIGSQGTDDPLLADTKIFDGKQRGKTYICKGFNQIYTYTQQYNEPFGYLVIYKTTDKDLQFSLKTTLSNIPVLIYNHKTIFLITIDIFSYQKPVSHRDPLKVISILEEDLIQTIRDQSILSPEDGTVSSDESESTSPS
jgi:hypothetical protein